MIEDDESRAWSFEEIRGEEVKEIQRRREAVQEILGAAYTAQKQLDGTPDQLVGMAFSGGGIRSATFNLGVLQGLARLGLLPRFDYLSTVSGGGYIGSWLAAWIKRFGLNNVLEGLPPSNGAGQVNAPGRSPEAEPIHWLRRYSNYLTPRLGFFSADTWALVATYLRNLLLNQAILISALAAFLLLPRLVTLLAHEFVGPHMANHSLQALVVIGVLVGVAAIQITRNMEAIASPPQEGFPPWTGQGAVLLGIALPLVLAAWLATCWVWFFAGSTTRPDWASSLFSSERLPVWWILGAAGCYTAPWLAGWIWGACVGQERAAHSEWVLPLAAGPAGAFGGILVWLVARLFKWWNCGGAGGLEHAMSWGTPLMCLLFTLVAVLHIGLMGTEFKDPRREWWARLGGHLLTLSLGWAALFGVALYSPLVLMVLGVWVGGKTLGGILGGGWIVSTLGGVLGGKSAKSGAQQSNRWLEMGIRVAPYVFILGLLVILAVASHFALTRFNDSTVQADREWELIAHGKTGDTPSGQTEWRSVYSDADLRLGYTKPAPAILNLGELHWSVMQATREQKYPMVLTCFGLALVAFLLAWRVDINEFSMHLLYRNRLIRCYLGASNKPRRRQPFTGFDADDDELLCNLSPNPKYHFSATPKKQEQKTTGADADTSHPCAGPYLLLNAALNLVKTKDLAWQRRKATSFIFSPRFCGFQPPATSPDSLPALPTPPEPRAYRSTRKYAYKKPGGGPRLGTAFAISGAAASPNMGYHSSPALAFLMTVFNVRLGWWMGNPQHETCWVKHHPLLGICYLLYELTGNTNDERGYVYLSDGGHFENLGIYELVRRRCRYILACDGSADADVKFGDLGNAIEKCRTDFGVDIEIDTTQLQPPAGSRQSKWHCAVGRIRYDAVLPGESEGTLVYLKTSLTGDEPADVRHYAAANGKFPHESTADQFFDESQFESYRALGYHIVHSTFGVLGAPDALKTWNPERLFLAMRQRWYPPSMAAENAFTRHTATLNRIFETLRCRPELAFLDAQIYPEWNTAISGTKGTPNIWLPTDPHTGQTDVRRARAGFYLCNEVIQLMEDVYTDLKLEAEFDHPDNRGWMNLFKHWSWSGMFRLTYAISASTYGARFQTFCERHLDLKLGDVVAGSPFTLPTSADLANGAWDDPSSIREKFNFVELRLLSAFVRTHSGPDTFEVHPLEMHVYDPIEESLIDQPAQRRHTRWFVFGLCVTRRVAGDKTEICYFRVQDHLRDMGLGRKALKAIVEKLVPREASLRDKVAFARPVAVGWAAMGLLREPGPRREEKGMEQFASLFESVLRDLEGERAVATKLES
jgi:hypothetical protein